MKFRNRLVRCLLAFTLSVAIALALLVVCAYLPQAPVDKNVLTSAYQIASEDQNPYFADHSIGTRMSFNSEALMLIESKGLDENHLENVLENNTYSYEGSSGQRDNLLPYALGEEPVSVQPYSRYWMGFRVVLRLLLQKLDYFQIRRYAAIAFFILFASVISSVTKNCNTALAVFFAVSITLVNPHVIAVSLQSFTCFCIAFIAMLMVPWISRKSQWEELFFMEIGIITMYFDFYTNPLVTFGLPMTYLYLLKVQRDGCCRMKGIAKDAFAWICGYGFMWLSKLILTTLFTSENGLESGISSFLWRTKVTYDPKYEEGYGPLDAIRKVFISVTGDSDGAHIFWTAVLLVMIAFLLVYLKNRKPIRTFASHLELLFIGCLPLIWFSVASQPTVIHYYFQYRIIAVTFWAVLSYLYLGTSHRSGCKRVAMEVTDEKERVKPQ